MHEATRAERHVVDLGGKQPKETRGRSWKVGDGKTEVEDDHE